MNYATIAVDYYLNEDISLKPEAMQPNRLYRRMHSVEVPVASIGDDSIVTADV